MPRTRICAGGLLAAIALFGAALSPAESSAPLYSADPAASRLEFTGIQAGAPFKAMFHKFAAAVNFSPAALADAQFDVVIDLNSVDSMDRDRDSTIRGADIFDAAHFATAHFVAHGAAVKGGAGYTSAGSLTLRGVTRQVPIEFTFANTAAGATLTGSAKLKRLDFGAGQGDWSGTEWVDNEVSVTFSLALIRKEPR